LTKLFIYIALIVSGASVLAIEMLGTRILGPFYGVSLYLWSALISVTLAALSVGYAFGGRWADRGPRLGRFCAVIGLAGVWILGIPWLRSPVLGAAEPAGLRSAVLITATVLFFPPLALLGMVSPYAIRLKATSLDVVGRTAGNLYAISTVASVAAAIATGFFLIPNMGVNQLTMAVGAALVVTALIGFASGRGRYVGILAFVALPLAGAAALRATSAPAPRTGDALIAVRYSAYAEIRVLDRQGVRYLLIDGGVHTAVDLETGAAILPYVNVVDLVRGFYEAPGRLLLVGLGGGAVANHFAKAGWAVDAVEIDPVVTSVAHEHFGLRPEAARVHHMDGRRFLMAGDEAYDLIVVDAFGSSSIPFHLVTREAFALIRSRLVPGGILAMNIEAVGWRDPFVDALAATAGSQFADVVMLPTAEPPNQLGNLVLLASERTLELEVEPPVPSTRFSGEYHRAHAWDNRFRVDATGVKILTDDHNPVDIWAERINYVARNELHRFFGPQDAAW